MPEYIVPITITYRGHMIVEAPTAEEAADCSLHDAIDMETAEMIDWDVIGEAREND